MGKRLYKTYLKEQLSYWKKKLKNADNPYKREHAKQLVENFTILIKEHRVK